MTEQLITEIQRKMLPYLNNEQLMHLRDAMAETLEGATITYDSGSIPAEETDAVEAFITAKRIEGCSEKTLSYYRKTIESLIAGVGKAVQQVATDDLRRYLTNYQAVSYTHLDVYKRQEMIGTENFGAYARKMLIDGYIIVVDYTEQKKLAAEINKIGVNINTVCRRQKGVKTLWTPL